MFKTTEGLTERCGDKSERCGFRCRQVAPALSADGTWPRASFSCGSGAERNQVMRVQKQKVEARPCNLQDLEDLLPTSWYQISRYHSTPSELLRNLRLDGSELFLGAKRGLHDIKQVVIIVWLIAVNIYFASKGFK